MLKLIRIPGEAQEPVELLTHHTVTSGSWTKRVPAPWENIRASSLNPPHSLLLLSSVPLD